MLQTIDILLFTLSSTWVVYLLIFAVGSLFPLRAVTAKRPARRIVVLIPAYREDGVIEQCVQSCLSSDYPAAMMTVVVIADRMQPTTLERLRARGASVLDVDFENSTKAKALNYAMSVLGDDRFDLALVLDADNTITPRFISQINDNFSDSLHALQAHRTAKNTNGSLAMLDAVSEEINNSIFRRGHLNLGLSAALIGSGMAFRYAEFKTTMASIHAVGGFDKELEHTLLEQRQKIGYLPHAIVSDEKVSRHGDFSNQRRRWMSAQLHYLRRYFPKLAPSILSGNWDFADKIFQMLLPPRVLLLAMIAVISLIVSVVSIVAAVKWWGLLAVLIAALMIAVPRRLYTADLWRAMFDLPRVIFIMALNLLKLRGANRHFIHTTHGK